MPTKTRSPSRISREAATTISSCGVYALLIRKVGGSRKRLTLDAQRMDVEPFQVRDPIRHVQHPLLEPRLEAVRGSRLRGVLAEEGVVPFEVALDGRRMGAAGRLHDGDDFRLREEDPVGIAQRDPHAHELLTCDDNALS